MEAGRMPSDVKASVTWLELLLILVLTTAGMGGWSVADWAVTSSLRRSEPRDEQELERLQVPTAQRRLAATEASWKATVDLLVQQRLEVARQSARMEALARPIPGPRGTQQVAGAVPSAPAKAYGEARDQRLVAMLLETRLSASSEDLEKRLDRDRAIAQRLRHEAELSARTARDTFERRRRLQVLAWAGLGALALLAISGAVVSERMAREFGIRRRLVLAASSVVLAALLGYQALHEWALAVLSLVLLLGLLLLLRACRFTAAPPAGPP